MNDTKNNRMPFWKRVIITTTAVIALLLSGIVAWGGTRWTKPMRRPRTSPSSPPTGVTLTS